MSLPAYAVLAHPGDSGALRVAAALRDRFGSAVAVLTGADLAVRARWWHRVSASGAVSTEVRTARGVTMRSDALQAVVCRLRVLAPPPMRAERDREYAAAELHALMTSFLSGLGGRVWNPPTVASLCGPQLSPFEWLAHAAACGLPVRRTTADGCVVQCAQITGRPWTALVAGDRVRHADGLDDGLAALSRRAGAPVLGVTLARAQDGRVVFCGADPCPPLDDEAATLVAEGLAA